MSTYNKMDKSDILRYLPHAAPFRFVDEILEVDNNGIVGTFVFNENLDFYKGHFPGYAVTPGVILTETIVQIGLACLGIFLSGGELAAKFSLVLSSTDLEFLKPVFPNEKVTVSATKLYFRFGKLKCKISMKNQEGKEVCSGTVSGMVIIKQ